MEKLRWGVIGAGGIADTRTIPGILEARNAELVALTARTPERAEQLRRKHGAKRAYTSEEELLRDPEVDAVYIATPVAEHYREGTLATQAGKHILMEKPLTVSADETKALIDCCEAHKVAFGAGFMMRFGTHVQSMRRAVLDGRIGTVLSGTANFTLWMPYQSGVWRLQKKNGGFGWMVARPESVFESSGTALLGLLLLAAYRISGEERFLKAAFRAEKALMGVTRRNGVLDMCQGDTKGIGMYSDVWSLMPFAQGMALRLSVELNGEEGKA